MLKETEESAPTVKISENASDSEMNSVKPLPPPNMDYLARKPWVPLKWSPTNKCSGIVLEDNTVVLIGTRKCEGAVRQSFLNYLRGDEGDLDDYLENIKTANTCPIEEQRNAEIVTKDIHTAVSMKSIEECSVRSLNTSGSSKFPSLHSVAENKAHELELVGSQSAMRKRSASNLSSSSDDDDLPRVQVTRRSDFAGKQIRGDAWEGQNKVEPEAVNIGIRPTMSGSGRGAEGGGHPLLKCPICNVSLPHRYRLCYCLIIL